MKLLAIDTSTEACSAALIVGREIQYRFEIAPRRHTELILPMVDQLLQVAGLSPLMLDGLAFGRGPGSFTGVRIAAGVIQGMAFGAGLPVAPISTLAALAQGAHARTGQPNVLAAIDARMGEVYWGVYRIDESQIMRACYQDSVASPKNVPLPSEAEWLGVGTGWRTYGTALAHRLGERLAGIDPDGYPHAREVALLGIDAFDHGHVVPAEQALPVYLRDQVIFANRKQD